MLPVLFGIALNLVLAFLVVGAVAAARRASTLSALWTLTNTLRSKRPLAGELTVQAEASRGRTQWLLERAANELREGLPLEQVLFHTPIVPRTCWLQIAGGLSAGKLSEALHDAASRETARFALSSSPTGTRLIAAYWSAMFTFMGLIIGFLMYYIVPKFKKIFEDFDMELPNATILLIGASDTFVNYWYLLLPALTSIIVGLFFAELYALFRGWAEVLEYVAGAFWVRLRAPDLLRGLRWAVIAQRPLDQTLLQMATCVPLPLGYRNRLLQSAKRIQHGGDPWLTLQEQGWLSRDEAVLLKTAQDNDHLAWALGALADASQATREFRARAVAECLHPLVVVITGCAVGMVVFCFFVPLIHLIFGLSGV
jgi:type IV pilus assembly protein PilC